MSPLISVIIAHWNNLPLLKRCLEALDRQRFRDFEIVVVDNGSTDDSVAWLRQRPDIHLITNKSNLGFAAANNQGIRASSAPLVALLNNDTEPEPGWLAALASAMSTGEYGMAASLMLFASRPDIVQSAGVAMDRAAIAWDRFGGRSRRDPVVQQEAEIFGPSGGAALYRRSMLERVGLLDERFFAYLEDVDLAWRAQRAGWRCRYVPGAAVLHRTSATSGEGSPTKRWLLGRNKVWLVAKNAALPQLPVILLYDVLATAYALLRRGEWHHALGRFAAFRELPAILRQRQGGHVVPPDQFEPLPMPWRVPARYEHLTQ
jgi:GT2 family glycosyltransferase